MKERVEEVEMKLAASIVPLGMILACVNCGQTPPPAQKVEVPVTAPAIDPDRLLTHIKALSADEYEGRAPGTKGEDLTVSYVTNQFQQLGLKPGNPDGTFIQKVPLVGITPDPPTLTLARAGRRRALKYPDDFLAWTKHVSESASLDNSELVFVGYGVVAPEYNWDDFKGLDLKGKTLVMLVNDPPVPDPSDPTKLDSKMFGGVAMTYYGRWTYKFDIAAKMGAAGAFVVHETGPAGYPYAVLMGNVGEKFDLVTPDKNMGRVAVEGWITSDRTREILAMAGQDFDALKKRAASRDFQPVPLGVTASIALHNTLRTIDSRNVVAKLEGSDPALRDEHVLYMAHWDHLGVGEPVNGDRIYNGAIDNASGVGALIEIARAFTSLSVPPKRSILFMAVTAEEQGLLGSEYYARQPLYPLATTLAAINMDALNVHGQTKDVTIIGLGNSDLDDYAREAAAEQGRVLRPDAEPEKGFYYRSDHFNFAKQGVPALNPEPGLNFVGKPADYGTRVRAEWNERDYHKPSDEVKPDWDLSGAVQDAQLFWMVGYRVAQAATYPEWKPGTEFKSVREAQVKMLRRD
jgi:Zn-dependent M28 family amino/carboxypeptidase